MDRLKARVNIFPGDPGSVTVSIETTRENFVPTLQLVTEILRDPIFPADEFDVIKKKTLAQYEQRRSPGSRVQQRDAAPRSVRCG